MTSPDDRVARIFNDPEPATFGSGWMSGTTSVFLGAIALATVACFYFPEILTSPDVRAVLPMPIVRTALQLTIGLAFLLGLISTMLRRRKVLGATGMGLALAASLAGGGNVAAPAAVATAPVYLGLDWFLLNVLLLAVLFVPLERIWPHRRGQSVFRPGWTTDGIYLFVSHLLVQVSTLLTLMPARVFFSWAVHPGFQAAVQSQPLLLQFLECVLVADLAEYWIHRGFHRSRWLCRSTQSIIRALTWTGLPGPACMSSTSSSRAAFHSSLMAPAESGMRPMIAATAMNPASVPLAGNVDARLHSDPEALRHELIGQICSSVRWVEIVATLENEGVTTYYEVGPGKVLAGLIARCAPDATVVTAERALAVA